MNGIFDIKTQVEERNARHQQQLHLRQKERRKEQIEDSRHKENTRLAKIAIVISVIALIVAVFKWKSHLSVGV